MTLAAIFRGAGRTVGAAWNDAAFRWASMNKVERTTAALIACMVAGGVVLRMQGIGFPPKNTFDEQFYSGTSHHYLVGVPDLHDYHPPLGKLIGAIGLLLYGFNSVGWRFMYLCFGLQTMVVAYWLAREIFRDRKAGWLAAAFVAADGFFIVYSRAGLIDGILTCVVLWSLLATVAARSWRGMVVAAIFVGAATSIKWSGAFVILPATLAVVLLKRVPWPSIFWFALSPVVHLLIWMAGLRLMGHPSDVAALKDVIVNSLQSLHGTGKYDNPLASAWYTWPVLYHPIVVKLSHQGTANRYASSAGNVVFWFPASLLVLGLPLARGVSTFRARWNRYWDQFLGPEFSHAVLLLALGWGALMSLFAVSMGKHMFFYHYQPSYGLAMVLLAGCAAKLGRVKPAWLLAFLALATAVAIYFTPVWGEFALSEQVANRYWLIFRPWQP